MRMHRKRNLEGRLAACSDLLIARGRPCLNLKRAAEEYRALFDFAELFQNDHPVHLEIGCGYGGFLAEIAKRNPDINFLAVEVCSNVILAAMERVKEAGLKNVRFLNIPAEILSCYLPEKSIGRIYLNFSTPLPRSGYANQRLTAPRFLEIYKKLLQTGSWRWCRPWGTGTWLRRTPGCPGWAGASSWARPSSWARGSGTGGS